MTPPIHVGLAQHPKKTGRGRGLSHVLIRNLVDKGLDATHM